MLKECLNASQQAVCRTPNQTGSQSCGVLSTILYVGICTVPIAKASPAPAARSGCVVGTFARLPWSLLRILLAQVKLFWCLHVTPPACARRQAHFQMLRWYSILHVDHTCLADVSNFNTGATLTPKRTNMLYTKTESDGYCLRKEYVHSQDP